MIKLCWFLVQYEFSWDSCRITTSTLRNTILNTLNHRFFCNCVLNAHIHSNIHSWDTKIRQSGLTQIDFQVILIWHRFWLYLQQELQIFTPVFLLGRANYHNDYHRFWSQWIAWLELFYCIFLSTQIISLLLKSVLNTIYYCFWLSV